MAGSENSQESPVVLANLPCDALECALLPLIRHLVRSHTGQCPNGWHHAFTIAKERWGGPIGLQIAFGLSNTMLELINARRCATAVHDPLRPDLRLRLTDDEKAILLLIHYMRRDNSAKAREYVPLLAAGRMHAVFIQAMLTFARSDVLAIPDRTAKQPRLTLVKN